MNTRLIGLAALLGGAALLAGCERPPINTVQHGYRGTGMVQVYNPRTLAAQAPGNEVPPDQPPAATTEGPKASQVFQNVKVLGDQSVAEFTRTMLSITAWVAPQQGCTYCHSTENLADDSKYTKVVARRMLEMTRHVNADWKAHVAGTGVTCYTCHRGQPVPSQTWFKATAPNRPFLGDRAGQNAPATTVGLTSLPLDPFSLYLAEGPLPIRIEGPTALPVSNRQSTKQAEGTYGLMMHMSQALGVNCTYCHNSRQFADWAQSTPQRVTAWHGIRMARDLNQTYLSPLASVFPKNRLGPTGDAPKLHCGTCHQGAYKPLNGQSMLAGHPELVGQPAAAAPAAMPASAAEPAPQKS
ncbi:photosynthetic reaction center cytochrome PufC [Aquabacterium sp.]|uniref:photosynthetic reaction center cytochrome PufC n=1 Tax=Aquabacterium sp. TaxID=1872578 RepID=UPI003784C123